MNGVLSSVAFIFYKEHQYLDSKKVIYKDYFTYSEKTKVNLVSDEISLSINGRI